MNRRFSMGRRAFTLIELVLAMAACAVILTAVYGVFSRALKLRDNATARIREARVQARAAAVIANDLRNARLSGGTLAATLEGSASGPGGSFPGYLRFTTTTTRDVVLDALEAPATDLQRVAYYIITDPDSTNRDAGLLVRTVEGDLLATTQETPPEEPLLADVASMEVEFYDGTSWQATWNYEETQTVPQGVRVRLQPAASESRPVPPPIEILVPWTVQPAIPAASATGDTQP